MLKSKINILIVEDEQNTMDFISAVLISDGYSVLKASKGKKAIFSYSYLSSIQPNTTSYSTIISKKIPRL